MSAGHRLRCMAMAIALVPLSPALSGAEIEVRIGYAGPGEGQPRMGADMSLEEINRAGGFLGYRFSFVPVGPGAVPDDVVAIIVTEGAESVRRFSEQHPDLAVFNTASDDDALRALCRHNLYSIMPSARMRADAVAQWQQKEPGARVEAVAHHHRFRRYSSADLNSRFRAAYDGAPMSETAWTAFVAVRLVGDAVTRTQSTDPRTVQAHLRGIENFDASKGQPLSFRADTGQLRQPLWLVKDDRVVGEAPVVGVVEDPDDMDSLGMVPCEP